MQILDSVQNWVFQKLHAEARPQSIRSFRSAKTRRTSGDGSAIGGLSSRAIIAGEIGAISRQAVYDALKAMFEHRLMRRIQPAGSSARYELRLDNHHHLVCRQCGSLVDTDPTSGKTPSLNTKDKQGYLIDEAEVIYWGTCPDCQ